MSYVVVLGAGGIIGQHMILQRPHGAAFYRRTALPPLYDSIDLTDFRQLEELLGREEPKVIVNLAGENRVDVVESDPERYRVINVDVPRGLASWCANHDAHLIQVSSQGIFSGQHAPYGPLDQPHPIHAYGRQKVAAERAVAQHCDWWAILRVTFVLGVRPFPGLGRENPLERMFATECQRQVNDRWFSPSFAPDVAAAIWKTVDERPIRQIRHLGVPIRMSRYDVATLATPDAEIIPASDAGFFGPDRPQDTTYETSAIHSMDLGMGIGLSTRTWASRQSRDIDYRSHEISLYLDLPVDEVTKRLEQGFGPNHAMVAEDFRAAGPRTDDELLEWYRTTESYIWELSAYHLDPGFNYMGMCAGIVERLKSVHARYVLVLGDGIGDLSMSLADAGLRACYHDLEGSRTADFAEFRMQLAYDSDNGPIILGASRGWSPELGTGCWDAVISLDFLEHVPNLEDWVAAIHRSLAPNGQFMAQNAFAIGDDDHGGSIPTHLVKNNRFEFDWVPLMEKTGFRHDIAEWWVK